MLVNLGILATAPACAASPQRERHAAFLADKLVLAAAPLAVAPLFLAVRGAPTPPESLLFAALLTPGAAALVVARTGRLAFGHAVAAAGLAAIGLILFCVLGAGAGTAIAWLVAAGLEAAALDRRLRNLAGLALGGLIVAVVAAAPDPRFAPTLPLGAAAAFAGAAAALTAATLRRLCAAATMVEAGAADRDARVAVLETIQGGAILDLEADGSLCALRCPPRSLLGAADATLLGRGLFDRVHMADRPAFLQLIDDAAHAGVTSSGRFRLRVDDGAGLPCHLFFEMKARRLPARDDETPAVVAVLEDVSDRSTQAQEFESMRRAVAEALRAKDQFMTTMSHELRTPLNAIIGFSEMLASRTTRPEDVAKQCEFARVINQSGQHLLGVVNAVLDVSRLQAGTYPLRPETSDAASLLDQSIEAVAAIAREGAVRLRHDYPAGLEEIFGDRRALKAALVAVLSNAVKFTPANGEVTLQARPEGTCLVVSVADAGCGIAADDMARLGQPFFQASGNLARPFNGAGLGLALVRGLVGLHGGAVAIESEIGLGTTVTLRLPLDCRAIADRTANLDIETKRRPPRTRLPTFAKDAA